MNENANQDTSISLSFVLLLVGHFHQTLTETQKDELDQWICSSDENMKVFEKCLEQTLLPKNPDPNIDEADQDLWDAAELLIKYKTQTLTPEQTDELHNWLRLAGLPSLWLKSLPKLT